MEQRMCWSHCQHDRLGTMVMMCERSFLEFVGHARDTILEISSCMQGSRREHDGMYLDATKLIGIPIHAPEITKRL